MLEPASLDRALSAHRAGNLAEAERLYKRILRASPNNFDSLHMLGVIAHQRGNNEQARELIARALKIDPMSVEATLNQGVVLTAMGRHAEALECWDMALALRPGDANALYDRANALRALGRHAEAAESYDRAAASYAASGGAKRTDALFMRGNALRELKRPEEAIASYDAALALDPNYAEAICNRANALRDLHRHAEALPAYDKVLALMPGHAGALFNRGNTLFDLGRPEEALEAYAAALVAKPDYAEALANRGNVLLDLKRPVLAMQDFERVLALDPAYPHAAGMLLQARAQSCDWVPPKAGVQTNFDRDVKRVVDGVRTGRPAAAPFILLGAWGDPADHRRASEIWVRDRAPPAPRPLWQGAPYRHDRIRIAYLSADFYDHPTLFLMAGLFERHDRARFEITAASYGPDQPGSMRARLQAGVEHFVDLRDMSDGAAAALLREREIDIAVDLKGYTQDCRTGILAHRPAPIQVNYLGYPGTMAAPYIDYIVADRFVIPEAQRAHYSEAVVTLPDSYQVNDRDRHIAENIPTRAEAGLPDSGFVFCAFGNSWKIVPGMFAVWMRLLRGVESSVLWLLQPSPAAVSNLRREAGRLGVAPERLVFAPRLPLADHLARHRLADLYLDTLPYNAHTSASDALWAGLPVVTCAGGGFAGRVGESLLNAVGLPELVTHSLPDYEALALRLATDPVALAALKARLAANRLTAPLFDTDRFRRHIEAAYAAMVERYRRGDPPADFAVDAALS